MSNNSEKILKEQLQEARDNNKLEDVQRLEALIKSLEEQTEKHQEEMAEATNKENTQKTMKMEELTNRLKDQPENAEKNAEEIVKQSKSRLRQTIDRYINKIKELKSTNESEKDKTQKELENIKAELKKEKEKYEQAKNSFFGQAKYNFETMTKEDRAKVPSNIYRIKTREGKLFNRVERTKMKTLRRNRTIKKLMKKFNKIGNEPTKGVRFVMNFEKERFLRYTSIKAVSWLDQAASAMGMRMSAKNFHAFFNAGRKNIFAILDADTGEEKTQGEKDAIEAIKKRINYYGEAYDRQRASERINTSLEANNNIAA